MVKQRRALAVFGLKVRQVREGKKLTQERLAELAELDPTYISGIERGVRNLGLLNLLRLAKALDIPAAKLLEGVKA